MSKVTLAVQLGAVLVLLALAGLVTIKPELSPARRPNIVLITIDLLRTDHLSFYGYSKPTTPFLDSLLAKGTSFKQAITPSYLTWLADTSILSSQYPSQAVFYDSIYPPAKALATLPRILSYEGYRSSAYVSEFLPEEHSLNQIFDQYHVTSQASTLYGDNLNLSSGEVENYLASSKTPYFLLWNIANLHTTYYRDVSPKFFDKPYQGPFADKKIIWEWVDQPGGKVKRVDTGQYVTITEEDREYLIGTYDSELNRIDQSLKEFFARIEKNPIYRNTVFILTSEHGEDLKEHGFFYHRDIYNVVTRIPLVFFGPGITSRQISDPVSSLDIMPTILGLLSIAAPQNIEGMDLGPALRGEEMPAREIYSERFPFNEYSVQSGRWKYILRNPDKLNGNYGQTFNNLLIGDTKFRDEFYDLETDPLEQKNLIDEASAIKEELKLKAALFRTRMRSAFDLNAASSRTPQKYLTYP